MIARRGKAHAKCAKGRAVEAQPFRFPSITFDRVFRTLLPAAAEEAAEDLRGPVEIEPVGVGFAQSAAGLALGTHGAAEHVGHALEDLGVDAAAAEEGLRKRIALAHRDELLARLLHPGLRLLALGVAAHGGEAADRLVPEAGRDPEDLLGRIAPVAPEAEQDGIVGREVVGNLGGAHHDGARQRVADGMSHGQRVAGAGADDDQGLLGHVGIRSGSWN